MEWLAPYRGSRGKVCAVPNLEERLREDRKRAGLTEWPSNGLRHSFASYHLAHFGDVKELALELGRTNPSITFRHYRQLVRPEAAERFWRIAPAIDSEHKFAVVA